MFKHDACPSGVPFDALRATAAAAVLFVATHSALAQVPAATPDTDTSPWSVPHWMPPQEAQPGEDMVPADMEQAKKLWLQANQEVAEFPRGHMDLMRWERKQAQTQAKSQAKDGAEPFAEAELGLSEVLQQSMLLRPDLMLAPGMSTLQEAQVDAAYADHRRNVQAAWIKAIEAKKTAHLQQAMLDNARTGTELGRRMVRAGNWSQARYMQEQLIEANAWQTLAQTRQEEQSAIAALATLMGVWQTEAIAALAERLPKQLPAVEKPPLTGSAPTLPADAMAQAMARHPGVSSARFAAERHLRALPPGRWSQWQNQVSVTLTEHGGAISAPRLRDRRLLNDEPLMEAVEMQAQAMQMATERRAQVRRAWAELQWRQAQAGHAEGVLLKLQTALEDETLLRYNGMLQSTWELLASARSKLQAVEGGVSARAAYWLAKANWDALQLGADDQPTDMSSASSGAGESATGGH
ncbi:TolC family protein [Hydrogenophaga sp. 5NK40-0174]|uniref:TolC family protein n=1 Tax=Hydrogenophaga sp. 5NK40-0174 TaxID=3127649 RepID=UPI0031059A73